MTAPFHFRFDRAVAASGLAMPVRHLLMCLNVKTDRNGHIPERFQPSYSELARMMGAAPRSVIKWVTAAEDAGWLIVTRPTRYAAQVEKARNSYRLRLPDTETPATGHVIEDHMPSDPHSHEHLIDVHTSQNPSEHSHPATQPPTHGDGVRDPSIAIAEAIERAGEEWDAASAAAAMIDRRDHPAKIVNVLDARTRDVSTRPDPWTGSPS